MAEPLLPRTTTFLLRVRSIVAFWRYGQREQRLALAGFASFAVAVAVSTVPGVWPSVLLPPEARHWLPWPFWLGGAVCLALAALQVNRRVTAPLPPPEARVSALKGPGSFTPDDAQIFAQLGRGSELAQLRTWILDDQIPLVVLMGESGIGKTSLLRAGLADFLKDERIETVYWEASPSAPGEGLLHAIRSTWPTKKGAPADLGVAAAAVGEAPVVVAIDQLEQLSPETHPEVFDVLRQAVEAPPPYRGTWIVSFRREYAASWMDFTLSVAEPLRRRVVTLSLKRFSLPAARRVAAVLAATAEMEVDQAVVDELVSGIAENGLVSPLDLGVTLLSLHEVAGEGQQGSVSLSEFRAGGGPAGLLTRYLERILAPFTTAEQSELKAALLGLVDLDSNQRLAEGLTATGLIERVRPASPDRFRGALELLASRRARVLEPLPDVAGEPRFRLLHERFIQPLRVLSDVLLSEATLAALRLDQAYLAWSRERRPRYLLSGAELRLVRRNEGRLRWGADEAAKRDFVRRSRQRATARRALIAAGCAGLLVLAVVARKVQLRREWHAEMSALGLPSDLAIYLPQLDTIEIQDYVSDLRWLRAATRLRALSVKAYIKTPMDLPATVQAFTCKPCFGLEKLGLPSGLSRLDIHDAKRLRLPPNLRSLSLEPYGFRGMRFPEGLTSLTMELKVMTPEAGEPASIFGPDQLAAFSRSTADCQSPLHATKLLAAKFINTDQDGPILSGKLPPCLTGLSVVHAHFDGDLSWVPRSVTSLTLTFWAVTNSPVRVRGAPTGLRRLELLGVTPQVELAELSSLTELRLSIEHHSDQDLPRSWPPALLHLDLVGGQLSNLTRLPQGLESLSLIGTKLLSGTGLPGNLVSLTLRAVPAPHDLTLPRGLQDLTWLWAGTLPAELPAGLRSLTTDEPWGQVRGKISDGLRSLQLNTASGPLEGLPPHLEALTVPRGIPSLHLPPTVHELHLE